MAAVLADAGYGGGDVGRLGHGLGMQLTEAPSLTAFDKTVLEPGMVLTLEPSLEIEPGAIPGAIMVHEENIVVRDGDPQLLTERAPAELPII
jgi:Xaa-Pro aminopeptidase